MDEIKNDEIIDMEANHVNAKFPWMSNIRKITAIAKCMPTNILYAFSTCFFGNIYSILTNKNT